MGSNIAIRRAGATDANVLADIFEAARAGMTYLPKLHTEEETRVFIGGLPDRMEVWVAEADGRLVGFAAIHDGWLDHLYVYPEAQSTGIGSALLAKTKERRPDGFQFWAFQKNTGARRFYARHGCREVEWTGGEGNEEKEPDVRFEWSPA
ncbi:MAG TPA: GNAT family N-acetyltransferase [Rhizomicrobium sp.]